MTVSEQQLSFDLDALARLVDQLHQRRRIETGAPRLLEALVRCGLDERALVSAAALCGVLDEPHDRQESDDDD
jgi:hypothetical protein